MLIQPSNGDIVVAGVSGASLVLFRYTPGGALDTTFGNGGEAATTEAGEAELIARSLAIENGDIVAGGFASNGGSDPGSFSWFLARYTPGGSPDTTFGNGGIVNTPVGTGVNGLSGVTSLLVSPDGKILAVGGGTTSTGSEWALGRYNADGSLDGSFGTGGITTSSITATDQAGGAALQSNGQIVVTGRGLANGVLEVGVYNADGSPDASFGSGGFVTQAAGSGGQGRGVVVQSDGKIVVAGTATVGGKNDFLLVRFGPSAAQVGSFTASPNPVAAGSSLTLTAANVTPADPSSTITQVAFYADSNGDGKLEPGADALLGYAVQSSPGVWTLPFTVGLPPGTDTLFAQAEDSDGVFGDPDALSLRVI
jgi:uncharacterized delta-60 repeat protein